ncbi:hypothetical protein DMH15_38860, partial [Streptomyces sp. WAC 06725]|uniref:hypothetical protein n=1 Tax=Streptomyces sp. WAC 06725 TaxID=2203209 RepID=UPI0010024EB4
MQYPATRTAAISTTALTLASALTVTAASALEHQDRHAAPKRLNASAHSGFFDVLTRQTTGLKAKFTERDGTPVAGLPVKFTVSGEKTLLCEAATGVPSRSVNLAFRPVVCRVRTSKKPEWAEALRRLGA